MMDLRQILLISLCLFFTISTTTFASTVCENVLSYRSLIYSGARYDDLYPFDSYLWYNTTFWDGYMRVAWKDNIGPHCKNRFKDDHFLVLTDEHKDILELNNNLTALQGCIMSQGGVCERNTTVDVLYCDGDLLYRFSDNEIWSTEYIGHVYICFDRIYYSNCSTPVLDLPAEYLNKSAKLVKIDFSITESGWYDSMYDGKNYTIPLLKDIDTISAVCYGDGGSGLYSQDEQYLDIGDVAVGIRVCEFSKHEYYFHQSARILSYICNQHVYVRSCNGKIQLDLTQDFYYRGYKCLIRADVVKVIPEVRHTVKTVDDGGKNYNQYDPFLQFKCSFKMLENHMYSVKWYLNGHYVIEKGPSRNASVLAVTEDELGVNKLNYKVKCAVSVHSKKRSDPVETTSDDFLAGFKIIDPDVSLSKSGNEIITVEQTVPIGCAYNDISSPTCEDTVSVVDKNLEQNICSDGVFATNAISPGKPYHSIKTQKQDETWDGMTTFAFKLETVDKTYDDKDTYDLFITHSGINAKSSGDTSDAKVRVTNLEYSKNKMCYSHVDPHMRTGNGRWYEQQREGDYILYRNIFSAKTEILVLERARYCSGNSGPVCACAIIVRAGADAFMINRCNGQPFEVEFIQCGNGGIIDVVRIKDSKYEIYTPIGSKISIHLLDGWANGRNMNVDIYLIWKDEGFTDGLCGQYDKNDSNDFLLRENFPHKQEVVKNNDRHSFSDSWRLKDDENLFKDHTIFLRKSDVYLPPICRHDGSITLEKCAKANEHGKRKRRAIDGTALKVKRDQLHVTRDLDSRKKRETVINITEEVAIEICKTAIYSSPAVVEFPDKLANENLTVVIGQFVFDVVQGNDASWAVAHVAALNDIARNILTLNPVFTTNHSDSVETFLSHTCVNNCSGHGVCLKDGLCSCTGMYRGHDCGVDIRIPPLIFDVQDGGYCDDTNMCTCMEVKSDNLFDGFKCHMKTIKVNFNGSYDDIGNSTEGGRYEDLYTGHCCTMSARQKRSDTTDNDIQPFIYGYDLSISNDGIHFGIVSSVYFYDDTCVYTENTSESVLVRIKEGFCFVNDTCIKQGFKQASEDDESYCAVCKPEQNKFSLTFGKCNQEEDGRISVAALIGIVIGSLIVLVVILLVVRYLYLKSSKRIRINTEINNRNRTEDISGSGLPDITMFDAAKPRLKTTRIPTPMEDAFTKDEMKARIYLNELVSPNEDDEIQPPRCDDIKYERGLSAVSLKIV